MIDGDGEVVEEGGCSTTDEDVAIDSGRAGASQERAARGCPPADLPIAPGRSDVIRRSRILPRRKRPRPVPTELRMCQERILLSDTLALVKRCGQSLRGEPGGCPPPFGGQVVSPPGHPGLMGPPERLWGRLDEAQRVPPGPRGTGGGGVRAVRLQVGPKHGTAARGSVASCGRALREGEG